MSFGLTEVFIFCGFYSGLVIFSLWMTVADKAKASQKVFIKRT